MSERVSVCACGINNTKNADDNDNDNDNESNSKIKKTAASSTPMTSTPEKTAANEKRKLSNKGTPGGGCPWLDGDNDVTIPAVSKKKSRKLS